MARTRVHSTAPRVTVRIKSSMILYLFLPLKNPNVLAFDHLNLRVEVESVVGKLSFILRKHFIYCGLQEVTMPICSPNH